MTTKNAEAIHAETAAEICRQIKIHSDRRAEIINERARLYGGFLNRGSEPVLSDDEKAVRLLARGLLNGHAPETEMLAPETEMLALSPEISRDRLLLREQKAIDLAIKILGSKELAARAAEAVIWAETNAPAWRELCRSIILSAIRLDALERRAQRLLEQCGDVSAVRLPLINIIGGRAISETPLGEIVERALAENVITSTEKRKAEND